MTLSVVIPTFNCAPELKSSLESAKWADEVVVVDMGSTDKTLEVAKQFNARIFQRVPKNGNFDANRKFAMGKAKGDWILKLDSDEILSEILQKEIQKLLRKDNGKYNGFNLPNRIFMFGQQIKHGFVKVASHELRLVRRNCWQYTPVRFHQQITVSGEVGNLKGYYDHFNVRSVADFLNKTNRYTELDARFYSLVSWWQVILAPFKSFLKLFFWQLGFLDGKTGFVVCYLYSLYNLVEKTKAYEYRHRQG